MTSKKTDHEQMVEDTWRTMLTTGEFEKESRQRKFFRLLPSKHKCKWCASPFDGPTSKIVELTFGKKQAKMNPKFCNVCEEFAVKHQGGAEIPLTMLFADIRGSTTLAENMNTMEFRDLIDRFYRTATRIFIKTDAMIDKLIGDEVVAFYMAGPAGKEYTRKAVDAARELLRKTGHNDPMNPWVPVGVGVHTGVAFVGAVGSKDGVVDVTALGDDVNISARLASQAKAGEVIISENTAKGAGVDVSTLEKRRLDLKGKSKPMDVWVIKIAP